MAKWLKWLNGGRHSERTKLEDHDQVDDCAGRAAARMKWAGESFFVVIFLALFNCLGKCKTTAGWGGGAQEIVLPISNLYWVSESKSQYLKGQDFSTLAGLNCRPRSRRSPKEAIIRCRIYCGPCSSQPWLRGMHTVCHYVYRKQDHTPHCLS